jgi:hypothetical protein
MYVYVHIRHHNMFHVEHVAVLRVLAFPYSPGEES